MIVQFILLNNQENSRDFTSIKFVFCKLPLLKEVNVHLNKFSAATCYPWLTKLVHLQCSTAVLLCFYFEYFRDFNKSWLLAVF